MNGRIKFLNLEGHWGFIVGEDTKEYFFHASGLKNVDFDDLEKNREVTFEDSEGSKGLRAEDIYV